MPLPYVLPHDEDTHTESIPNSETDYGLRDR